MRGRIEKALDKVRPALKADGGDARVVECDEMSGKVSIEMLGACGGCPSKPTRLRLRHREPDPARSSRGPGHSGCLAVSNQLSAISKSKNW